MTSQVSTDNRPASGAFLPVLFCAALEGSAVAAIDRAEHELRRRAATDENRCAGFFPTLSGVPGIESNYPSCRNLMRLVPKIEHEGRAYRFNFIRLSLISQASQPAWHIDSDAATALTGVDVSPASRLIHRLLLNLSGTRERVVAYLDVDVLTAGLVQDSGYIRPANTETAAGTALSISIPVREGSVVHGISFVSNRIFHSGQDGADGHFLAAYGCEVSTSAQM